MSTAEQIDRALLDEALRVGNHSVSQMNKHMRISGIATDAIAEALTMMKCGKITDARARLERALLGITRLSAQ